MNAATNDQVTTVVRILKIATCPSMSGKSKLTYHIGCTADSKILFRVYANTAAGFFSKEWVALTSIQQLFGKVADAKAITSSAVREIFHGKSINTPAFLFAVLFSEGLVKPSTTTKRCYECTDGRKFFAQVDALAASNIDLTDKLTKITDKAGKTVTGSGRTIVVINTAQSIWLPDSQLSPEGDSGDQRKGNKNEKEKEGYEQTEFLFRRKTVRSALPDRP